MLLVIDVGNTNIKMGVYDGGKMIQSWRMSVKVERTSDEFGAVMGELFAGVGVTFDDIDGVIMSSVCPPINYTIEHACEYYIGIKPMMVGMGIKTGLDVKYTNPHEVGADRIVNSVAAYKLYGGPCIVVDFGTATTFNLISERGEFLGGVHRSRHQVGDGVAGQQHCEVDQRRAHPSGERRRQDDRVQFAGGHHLRLHRACRLHHRRVPQGEGL